MIPHIGSVYYGVPIAMEPPEPPVKIPLSHGRTERDGKTFSDGSFVRVWVWGAAPESLRRHLNGRLKDIDFIVLSPRRCDQYSAKLFCEFASVTFITSGEVDYEGVACTVYVTGRDD